MESQRVTSQLRAGAEPGWTALATRPFVVELASGTLAPERFRFYIEQNLQYLPCYARALALGAARSRDEAALALFAAAVRQIVEVEIPENRHLLERVIELGAADRGGSSSPAQANQAYTGWLLSLAMTGSSSEILAAVLPCTWSYGVIGRRLAGGAAAHPIYHEWLSFFASDQYAEVVERMRADFEQALIRWPSEQVGEIFSTAVRMEGDFWEMAYTLGGRA